MKIERVGRALRVAGMEEELSDGEELAFALAATMLPVLEELQEVRAAARSEIEAAEAKIARLEQELEACLVRWRESEGSTVEASRELERAERRLAEAELRPWQHFRWLWLLIYGRGWKAELASLRGVVDEAQTEHRRRTEDELGAVAKEREHLERQLKQFRTRRDSAHEHLKILKSVPRIARGVRRLDYPVFPLRMIGTVRLPDGRSTRKPHYLFIDPQGAARSVVLPVVSLDDKSLADLEMALDEIDVDAVLLDPGEEGDRLGHWRALLGEEKTLLDVARGLKEFADATHPKRFHLPLVQLDSVLGRFLSKRLRDAGTRKEVDAGLDRSMVREVADYLELQESFADVFRSTQRRSERFYRKLQDATSRFTETHSDWEVGRQRAAQVMERLLTASQVNSRIVRYHFYCPSCNATPPYLESYYRISEESIRLLNTPEVVRGLRRFLQRRLASERGKLVVDDLKRAEIEESWERAFDELHELERRYRAAAAELESEGDALEVSKAALSLQRAFNRRETRNINAWYRDLVRSLVRRPFEVWQADENQREDAFLEGQRGTDLLNVNTRLQYRFVRDFQGLWTCPLCRESFDTQAALTGAVDRIRQEVVYPLVTTLWTDEAVWSKTVDAMKDAGREIRDRVEQEMKALQGPIDNFKADLRQIRSRLDEATAKGRATAARLEQIAEQFGAVGLLPPDDLTAVKQASDQIRARVQLVAEKRRLLDEEEQQMERIIHEVKLERGLPEAPERQFIHQDARSKLLPFRKTRRLEVQAPLEDPGTQELRLDAASHWVSDGDSAATSSGAASTGLAPERTASDAAPSELDAAADRGGESRSPEPDPKTSEAPGPARFMQQAIVALEEGDLDKARQWLVAGVRTHPDDPDLRAALAQIGGGTEGRPDKLEPTPSPEGGIE